MVIVINASSQAGVAISDIPVGSIVLWYGTSINLPAGYAICNGTSGTPDMRGKFVRGASSSGELLTTGGASTHLHSGGVSSITGAHTHSANPSSGTTGTYNTFNYGFSGTDMVTEYLHDHSIPSDDSDSGGDHDHTSSTSGTQSSIPVHKLLYWIKRII